MQVWPAPAKLNLFLHVTGRRDDGYHLLQTVFQFLDFADELRFRVTDDGAITRAMPLPRVAEETDITLRAARLLKTVSGTDKGVEIHLNKRIPLGGGLGGGSSDAATTLLALNHLWGVDLQRTQLIELGLQLGADVPVFIGGRAAWAEGVGEVLMPIEPEEVWYVVLVPPVQVSTAQVFRDLGLAGFSPPITISDFQAGRVRNDLEHAVRERYPEVDKTLQWLARFGQPRMTGSGACVYLPVKDEPEGRWILGQHPQSLSGFVARGVNIHPLFAIHHESSSWGVGPP
ncbi:MAG: 4-(cytidine 5'-diphospho)-2-C-methyl-D-erythritol kinase [Acidiferrobacterales bacterium]